MEGWAVERYDYALTVCLDDDDDFLNKELKIQFGIYNIERQ